MTISVLVADDSKFARRQLLRALPADWDADVSHAKDGQEALDFFREHRPSLMFLDLTMPDVDGFQVLQTLSAEFEHYNVIVISADVQPKAAERAKELGALSFIKKPIDVEELNNVLGHHGFL